MTPLWDQNNPLGMPLKSSYQTTCSTASTLVFAARENLLTSLSAGMHECIETCRAQIHKLSARVIIPPGLEQHMWFISAKAFFFMSIALIENTRTSSWAFSLATLHFYFYSLGCLSGDVPVDICVQNRIWPGMSGHQTAGFLWRPSSVFTPRLLAVQEMGQGKSGWDGV